MALILVNAAAVSALEISYSVEISAFGANDTVYTTSKGVNKDCESKCTVPMPSFNIPEGYAVSNYTLIYESSADYRIYFSSTKTKLTDDVDDTIAVEILKEEAPVLVCGKSACDKGCVKCNDGNCHEQGFKCIEDLAVERVFPSTIETGAAQLNILIRNSGTVDLQNIRVEITGDGLTTESTVPISEIVGGDKDYAFLKINAEKPGMIDFIIKIYVDNVLKNKIVGQITVTQETVVKNETPEEKFNVTELSSRLDRLKEKYNLLNQDYQSKKVNNYVVDVAGNTLNGAYDYITQAQFYLFDGSYAKTKTNLEMAESGLKDAENQLNSAQKQKVTFMDKVKLNLVYFGSMAAAIVSMFAAYKAITSRVNKKKIIELHKKIRKKGEMVGEKKISRKDADDDDEDDEPEEKEQVKKEEVKEEKKKDEAKKPEQKKKQK
jgi:hypothetical protein